MDTAGGGALGTSGDVGHGGRLRHRDLGRREGRHGDLRQRQVGLWQQSRGRCGPQQGVRGVRRRGWQGHRRAHQQTGGGKASSGLIRFSGKRRSVIGKRPTADLVTPASPCHQWPRSGGTVAASGLGLGGSTIGWVSVNQLDRDRAEVWAGSASAGTGREPGPWRRRAARRGSRGSVPAWTRPALPLDLRPTDGGLRGGGELRAGVDRAAADANHHRRGRVGPRDNELVGLGDPAGQERAGRCCLAVAHRRRALAAP